MNRLVWYAKPIQIGSQPASRSVPPMPCDPGNRQCRTDYEPRKVRQVHWGAGRRLEDQAACRIPRCSPVASEVLRQRRYHGHRRLALSALGLVRAATKHRLSDAYLIATIVFPQREGTSALQLDPSKAARRRCKGVTKSGVGRTRAIRLPQERHSASFRSYALIKRSSSGRLM